MDNNLNYFTLIPNVMKIKLRLIYILGFFYIYVPAFGQNINGKDLVVSTTLTDNFTGRTNIGIEYFLPTKKAGNQDIQFSLAANTGFYSLDYLGKKVAGYSVVLEANMYTPLLLSKKWNEFGGIKLVSGNLENKTDNRNYQQTFFGLSTGIQPVIARRIAIKISSDIGYCRNGLTNAILLNDRQTLFYSGFAILFNAGVGIRF